MVYADRGISRGMRYGIERAQKEGRPVEYRTLRPIKIVTITGPSGVGKTSIVRKILELKPNWKLVVSLTTRDPRLSDLAGEYRHNISRENFNETEKFLWVVQAHGNAYGTLKNSVGEALAADTPSFMLLVPESINLLRKYAEAKSPGSVLSFYVCSPPEEELRRRLTLRGESEEAVGKRVADCRKWDAEAKESDTPYIFVANDEPEIGIEKAARTILRYLGID